MRRLLVEIALALFLVVAYTPFSTITASAYYGTTEGGKVTVGAQGKQVDQSVRPGTRGSGSVRSGSRGRVLTGARAACVRAQIDPSLRGSACSSGGGAIGVAPVVTVWTFTIADVQQLPLPAGTMVVEPPGGYVLAEVPANVYASSTGQSEVGTSVLGIPVMVRVTPVAWSWDFGDGGRVGPTSDPGGPYPKLVNTHTYRRVGSYAITMTTHYSAELSVSGGPYEPIPGRATVASDPVTVQVLAGRTELRAG